MKTIKVIIMMVLVLITTASCINTKGNSSSVLKEEAIKPEKLSISQTLKENNHLPIKEQVALYLKLKKESPDAYNFENEDELTMYGYSYLWGNEVTEAIEIFKLIVQQFPNSSNPYDSLGEGYMVNGNNELAILNYEKSLALNPDNFNAEDQIERIKNPEKKLATFADKFSKVYTIKAYKEDLNQLGKKLIEVHPNALKFISEKDFWETIKQKKALLTESTTFSEFYWYCSEIIANINCSHTSMSNSFREADILPVSLRFPIQTRWINEQLFVIDPLNNKNNVAVKNEIVSINGIVVSELIDDIYKHIPSQGYIKTSKRYTFNALATSMIPYSLKFPTIYKIKVKGKENSIVLNKAKIVKNSFNSTFKKQCDDNLCLEFLDNNKNAVLTISSFNYYPWNNLSFFKQFIDNSIQEINEKDVENLIIDLRFNGGGSPESSIHLLKYLIDKPFNYFSNTTNSEKDKVYTTFNNGFKGKLYFIIDGNGKSTTGHFIALVKDLKLGTIVGEELGSNQFCTAGQTILRLSNTKLKFNAANSTSKLTISSLPDEVGILPDFYVTQSIDDYLNKVDTVKNFTFNLIEKQH
ncbi:MAG: S41 family peptidase [Flavobacteriaceae bacterium]|nr:S41 family peptidase [Flavobacteriaceae bacterium]